MYITVDYSTAVCSHFPTCRVYTGSKKTVRYGRIYSTTGTVL